MNFRISALPYDAFDPLFTAPPTALAARRARLTVADAEPGFPCRVSLRDAAVGESVLLIHHVHQPASSPFQASHAIYVRQGAIQAVPKPGEVPPFLVSRALSLRGFDAEGFITGGELVAGTECGPALCRLLAAARTAYVHIHFAKFGCYAARAERA